MGFEFNDNTEGYLRLIDKAGTEGLRAASLEAAELAQSSMPGAGAKAIRTSTGRLGYVPSTPGQPPGIRSGLLRNSITNARINDREFGYGTRVKYGRYLETGTRRGVSARPFLRTVMLVSANLVERRFFERASQIIAQGATS